MKKQYLAELVENFIKTPINSESFTYLLVRHGETPFLLHLSLVTGVDFKFNQSCSENEYFVILTLHFNAK